MRKLSAFTPRKSDYEKLVKLNKSLRSKEKRLNKNFGKSLNFNVMTMKDFKSNDLSRKEFNKYIEEAKYHTSRSTHRYIKNSKGFVIPRTDYNKAKRNDERYQRRAKRELKKTTSLKATQGGQDTGYKVGDFEVGTGQKKLDHFKMPKFDFNVVSDIREWEMKQRNLEKRSNKDWLDKKNHQFYENYKASIRVAFGHGDNQIDENDMGFKLYEAIDNMGVDEFMQYYYSEFDVSIAFIYNSAQRIVKLNHLHNIFGVNELDESDWEFQDEDLEDYDE